MHFETIDVQGNFLSPSGISDPCGTVTGMVTPKGSISTEGETLQVCLTLLVLDIFFLLSVLVIAQPSSEVADRLMNYPVFIYFYLFIYQAVRCFHLPAPISPLCYLPPPIVPICPILFL
jgi:hypothetical protein